eukprot:8827004-Pyramimonas_sp.AAC.1
MAVASAHAPHEESTVEVKDARWNAALQAVRRYKVDIFVVDLNGPVGDYEAPGIGAQGYPEPTNANGERIIPFAAATGMAASILPATMGGVHALMSASRVRSTE